jgi:uncharacterized membrane protein (UPF0182 family)
LTFSQVDALALTDYMTTIPLFTILQRSTCLAFLSYNLKQYKIVFRERLYWPILLYTTLNLNPRKKYESYEKFQGKIENNK